MNRKRPQTFDETIAEAEEALKLGLNNVEDLYKPKLVAISCRDFLSMELPPREFVIEPCLPRQGLAMIYAKRGIGKTFFALFLACKIADGANLFNDRWKVSKPRKVLYLDGEMAANVMQERLKNLSFDFQNKDNLLLITPDQQINGMTLNLATEEGQRLLEQYVEEVDVIIVDNLSTLAQGGKENEAQSWIPIQEWALRMRARGKTIIFIHHAGKNSSQRGTSKKEDILDTMINLKHPSNYNSKEGARFEIHFEKSRGFAGDGAKPFEVKLELIDGKANWHVSEIEDLELRKVVELSNDGLTQREIANETGISLSSVNRILKKNKETSN